jgi:hypothetical protein
MVKEISRIEVLKTVGDPYKRFGEDYLRMMRLLDLQPNLILRLIKIQQKQHKNCLII